MTDSERVAKVITYSKLSKNAFATHIGYKKGQSIYNLIDGYRPITVNIATKICKAFPEISKAWLLTEEGSMFLSKDYMTPELNQIVNDPHTELTKLQRKYIDRLEEENERLKEEIHKLKKD